MQKQHGFTALELIVAIIVLITIGTVFWMQKDALNSEHRDTQRKTAINTMAANLEELIYPAMNGYPQTLDLSQFKAMDPDMLKDPSGIKIGEQDSTYRYTPTDCSGSVCKHFTLRADLEREADYEKKSAR